MLRSLVVDAAHRIRLVVGTPVVRAIKPVTVVFAAVLQEQPLAAISAVSAGGFATRIQIRVVARREL
jgi:hypothetical protein